MAFTTIHLLDLTEEQAADVRELIEVDRARGLTYSERRVPVLFGLLGHTVRMTILCPNHVASRLQERLDEWGKQWQADASW